jgi:hypothetical protein
MREPILQDAVDLLVDLTTCLDTMLRGHLIGSGELLTVERLNRRCHEYLKQAADLPPFEAETVGCLVELPLDGSPAVYSTAGGISPLLRRATDHLPRVEGGRRGQWRSLGATPCARRHLDEARRMSLWKDVMSPSWRTDELWRDLRDARRRIQELESEQCRQNDRLRSLELQIRELKEQRR